MPVKPVGGSRFPLAIAQRIDLRVQLPPQGAFPILALRENAVEQTGIILAYTQMTPDQKAAESECSFGGYVDSRLGTSTYRG